ncbi:Down syndrome cell adhesion molecule Dscam2, partial [Olea europaea subsp. europaea]
MNSTRLRLSQAANASSLTILQAQPRLDEANYECALAGSGAASAAAASQASEEKTHQFKLRLLVPPRLAPFEFPADAQVGMKVLLTCSALEGQQPISFVWLRDNQIIEPSGTSESNKMAGERSVASLGQVHQQQLADKFALSAHSAISLGQRSAYVLIGGGQQGPAVQTTARGGDSLDEDPLGGVEGSDTPPRDASGRGGAKTQTTNRTQAAAAAAQTSMQLSDSSIRIRQADDYSILSIEPLELKHSGRYTCSAQNEAARVSHSSQLSINGRAGKWPFGFLVRRRRQGKTPPGLAKAPSWAGAERVLLKKEAPPHRSPQNTNPNSSPNRATHSPAHVHGGAAGRLAGQRPVDRARVRGLGPAPADAELAPGQ